MKKWVIIVFAFLLVGNVIASHTLEINTVLLKVGLTKGSSILKEVNVYSSAGGELKVRLSGNLPGVSLESDYLIMDKNEKKNIPVFFNSSSLEEGVYVGRIGFKNGGAEQISPVVFEVESEDLFFDSNLEIPVSYSEITPGEKLIAQIRIFDLIAGGGTIEGLGQVSVDVDYLVYDLDGNLISSDKENVIVDKQVSISKVVQFSDSLVPGKYVFSTVLRYKNSVGVSSAMFNVVDKKSSIIPDFGGNLQIIIIGLIVLVFFIVFLFFFVFFMRERDKMFLELIRYNKNESACQKQLLNEQKNVLIKQRVPVEEIKKEMSKKVSQLKGEQKKRVEEIKKLKKRGKTDVIKKKVNEWKNKGYKMTMLNSKLSKMNVNDMKKLVSKWKDQGYYGTVRLGKKLKKV